MTKFAWMCPHEVEQPEVLLEQAVAAEEAGFDAVVCSDLFHPWVDDRSAAGFAWSWLGAVAARTERIELVTTVTAPLYRYHPAVVAQAAATVDRLSGGRFVLGVGIGDPISQLALGWPPAGYRERVDRLREAVGILRQLWAGESVTHAGRHFRLDRARLFSPPYHPIRLLMAADGPRSAAVAGGVADGVITSVKDVERTRTRVLGPYRDAGGTGPVLATRWCVLAESDDEAWDALAPLRGLRVPGRDEVADPALLRERADRMPRHEVLGRFARARGFSELIEIYRPLVEDLRADYVSIQVASVNRMAALRIASSEVIPALRP